jgi:hypothetical protein
MSFELLGMLVCAPFNQFDRITNMLIEIQEAFNSK